MPVAGMSIKAMSAKRHEDVVGEIEVNNDAKLTTVEETDLPAFGKKAMTVGFSFTTDYIDRKTKKKLAEILIDGSVLYMSDDHANVVKGWKTTKKLPEDVNIEIINAILRRCITKAVVLSEDLQMPPPMMIPHAQRKGAPANSYTM